MLVLILEPLFWNHLLHSIFFCWLKMPTRGALAVHWFKSPSSWCVKFPLKKPCFAFVSCYGSYLSAAVFEAKFQAMKPWTKFLVLVKYIETVVPQQSVQRRHGSGPKPDCMRVTRLGGNVCYLKDVVFFPT